MAGRTQESTKEIQAMIENIQAGSKHAVSVMDGSRQQAHESVGKAAAAGDSLKTITAAVAGITDMNTQIAAASEEQSAVSEQISQNIIEISHVAEETEKGAEQTARAGKELTEPAGALEQEVQRFKLS